MRELPPILAAKYQCTVDSNGMTFGSSRGTKMVPSSRLESGSHSDSATWSPCPSAQLNYLTYFVTVECLIVPGATGRSMSCDCHFGLLRLV
jgi:hypothetical protein